MEQNGEHTLISVLGVAAYIRIVNSSTLAKVKPHFHFSIQNAKVWLENIWKCLNSIAK